MNYKKCAFCGKELIAEARFCGYCGKELGDDYIATETIKEGQDKKATADATEQQKTEIKAKSVKPEQIRPWVRFWARQFDYALFGLALAIGLAFVYPELLETPQVGYGLLVVFLWVFVEPFFLSTWGTTPGKWFCKTTVRDLEGKKLTYSTAIGRSLNVWIRGLGFGIPLVSTITAIVAYSKLTSNGKTTWDTEGGFQVLHNKIGFIRAFFMILLFIAYYALTYIPE